MHTPPRARDSDWEGVRLHVVTGKGGTGKTTAAAALALGLASGGRKVLLIEVEGRQGIAQLFDVPPLPYEERKVAVAPGGGDVFALVVDPEEALLDYLAMFYNLRQAGRALTRLGVMDFATTIAPGLRDVLLTGKATEAVRRRDKRTGRFVYDAVVMDAPPTGRITRFLNVNTEVAGIARVGPIRNHADAVMKVIGSPQTAVHFVTLLEDMPAQETLDGIEELRAAGLPAGGIIVNMVRSPLLSDDDMAAAAGGGVDTARLVLGLKAAGLDEPERTAEGLSAELVGHARRVALERNVREVLERAGLPCYELPLLPDDMDLAGLYRLAGELREQEAA
ncbi:ArsA-related P-loop ATPase [Allonocardiopsis opalescens]|uniref:Arsenite efflux ATP-binding protein ArsA n=1 Tax=Allonocardiopsis opalescens TaxID=1144618 RepID=A0A2T0Q6R6_9ACTN|nr:ArsA-related P-loop ATPase [Allonocardiopsis opalescens]PRX99494.1 arsenite efflux ATP-binding protein ArsA [Allonocardiopsis opalescens]